MRYAEIKKNDIANGYGIRVSLWTQGCPHKCKDCFNQSTWDYNKGHLFTDKELAYIKSLLSDPNIHRNFSILGGEPLLKQNIERLTTIIIELKKEFPKLNIWIWTGYTWGEISHLEILKYIDILVDGRFEVDKKDLMLKYRGSTNQRIIDVKESLKQNKIILADI